MADTVAIRIAVLEIGRVVGDFKRVGDAGDQQMQRLGRSAEQSSQRMDSLKDAIGGIGLQLQDVAVQLQSGTSIFTVIAQQAPQALSAFGGLGIAIGTVTALVSVAAGVFFGLGKNVDLAKEASKQFEDTQKQLDKLLGGSVENVDKLRASYEKLHKAQKDAVALGLQGQSASALSGIRAEQGRVGGAFEALGGSGRIRELQGRLSRGPSNLPAGSSAAQVRDQTQSELNQLLLAQQVMRDLVTQNTQSTKLSELALKATSQEMRAFSALAMDASVNISELNRQLKVTEEKAQELRAPGTGDVGILGGSPETERRIKEDEQSRIRSLKAVAAEQSRIEKQLAAERKREYQASLQLIIGQAEAGAFGDARDPAARERGARVIAELQREEERRTAEREREMQRQAERQADILTKPFQDAAEAGTNAFSKMYLQILEEGKVTFSEVADTFAKAITTSAAQIPSLLLSIPLSVGIKSITDKMATEIAAGNSGLGAFMDSPFGAGALGASAGMLGSSMLGGNQTGSAIGSLGGAVLGGVLGSFLPGIGTAIGAGFGGAAGGLIGGLVGGGGGGNNNASSTIRLGTGLLLPGTDTKSAANQNLANNLLAQLAQTQQLLVAAGAKFSNTKLNVAIGDKSGYKLRGPDGTQDFDSLNKLGAGAYEALFASGSGYSATLSAVIESTKGKRAEVIADALAFAAAFDKLTSPAGALIEQLRQLNIEFDQAAARANSYGVDVAKVETARAKATAELLEGAEDALTSRVQQIKGAFESLLDPIRQTITGINIGGLSTLSPSAQLDLARGQFQGLAGKALAGDETSIQQLSGAGQTFLQQARQFGASGETFQAAFREVNTVLSQVVTSGEARQQSILASLPDAIRDANTDTIAALQKGFGEMVDQVALLRAEIARVRPLAA